MFNDYPTARLIFAEVNGNDTSSPVFKAHSQRVLGGIDISTSMMVDSNTFAAELEHLRVQHAARGILADYFDVSISI